MAAQSLTARSRSGLLASISEGVRSRLWPVPVAGVVLAALLGLGMVRLDELADDRLPWYAQSLLFGGDSDAARAVLEAVASSLITVTSLTFSLTVVTLQLASSQFSPRLLRTFAADRFVQHTLALFLATFVFALTVLRSVRGQDGVNGQFVPRLSVTVAFVLTVASVLALVLFLAHLAREIRVENVLTSVHRDAAATIRRELEESDDPEATAPRRPADARPVLAPRSGFLSLVEKSRLLETATDLDVTIWVDSPPGASVVEGTPLAFLTTTAGPTPEAVQDGPDRVRRCLHQGSERAGASDISFALRQITDVAVKALSPGINDPTTASHALGHSAALLCLLSRRRTGPVVIDDDDGRLRVVVPQQTFAQLLALAVAQPRHYGAAEPAVHDRLLQLLREVAWTARSEDRRDAIADQLELTVAVIEDQDFDAPTRAYLDARVEDVRAALRGQWP